MNERDAAAYQTARSIAIQALQAGTQQPTPENQRSNAELAKAAAEVMKACKANG